jgi:hypothetical protein
MELLEDKSKHIEVTAPGIPPNNLQHSGLTLSIYRQYPLNEKDVVPAHIHPININLTKTFIKEIGSLYDPNQNEIGNPQSL